MHNCLVFLRCAYELHVQACHWQLDSWWTTRTRGIVTTANVPVNTFQDTGEGDNFEEGRAGKHPQAVSDRSS